MIPYAEARRILLDAARGRGEQGAETVALKDALGRVAAEPVAGREAIPPFDNSSMDGYALASARAAGPNAVLPVLGTIMAGDPPRCRAESGAWRIMTGAPIPAGCDAVVPVERTKEREGGRMVELLDSPHAGDFVRGRGRDFAEGARVLPAGARLGARHLLALAAVGAGRVSVRRKPRIALLATGRELAEPGAALMPGQIRDASSTYLAAAATLLGVDLDFKGVIADDPRSFQARLDRLAPEYDVLLTTGAVSMGDADFIPNVLTPMGAETLFHKVAIRPGKPVLFARFEKGPFVFGLPGNPVSTVVGLRFFVEPFLRELLGRPEETPVRRKLSDKIEKPEGLRCFFKARHVGESVEILPGQASFQIHSLLSSDSWAVLPEEGAALDKGAEVDVYPLAESLG